MLIVDTKESQRRCERLEEACTHAIASYQNWVAVLQKQVAQSQAADRESVMGKLTEKLLKDIAGRNKEIEELTKQKHLIESNKGANFDAESIAKIQRQLDKMVKEFEKVINERVSAIKQLMDELNKVFN